MTVEFIGTIHHRHASEIHQPGATVLDRDYIRSFAQAAEAGGFDRLLAEHAPAREAA